MARLVGGVGWSDWEDGQELGLEPGLIMPLPGGRPAPRDVHVRETVGGSVQTGAAAMAGDSSITLAGFKVGDRSPPRIRVVPRDRASRFAKQLERRRGWVWYTATPGDLRIVQAQVAFTADATLSANGTAVAPNGVDGAAILQADATWSAAGGVVPGGVAVTMVADAIFAGLANVRVVGQVLMQADSQMFAQGTGGSAGPNALNRRSGIISIGIRGGHS